MSRNDSRSVACATKPRPNHNATQTREYRSPDFVTKTRKTLTASRTSQPETSERRSSTRLPPRCGRYSPVAGKTARLMSATASIATQYVEGASRVPR